MTTLNRMLIQWSGGSVNGSAVTVLHFSGSDNAAPPVAAVRAAFAAAAAAFPGNVQLAFPNSGDAIQDTTGNLVGVWQTAAVAPVVGSGPVNQAAGVGACISWTTGGIVNGKRGPRKLRGRTFLVPLAGDAWESNGTLGGGYPVILGQLATSIAGSGPLAIWHRPTTAGAADGNSYGVQTWRVRDKLAMLKSRRD